MRYHLYIIEAVQRDGRDSVIRKFKKKHQYSESISSSLISVNLSTALDPKTFSNALEQFIEWQENQNEEDMIILCLSIHGSQDKRGVVFDNLDERDALALLEPINRKTRRQFILVNSICWGAYPWITRAMNKAEYGPVLTFGPTVEVNIAALHHAEAELLRFIAGAEVFPVPAQIHGLVDQLREWGQQHYNYDYGYYRVWYWGDGIYNLIRYPDSNQPKVRRVV